MVGMDFAMNNQLSISNMGDISLEILIEPTADSIDLPSMNIIVLKFRNDHSSIDSICFSEDGIVQIFVNPENEFVDYSTNAIIG